MDLPFVLAGALICFCIWRSFFYIRHVFFVCKKDTIRRKMTAQYLGIVFAGMVIPLSPNLVYRCNLHTISDSKPFDVLEITNLLVCYLIILNLAIKGVVQKVPCGRWFRLVGRKEFPLEVQLFSLSSDSYEFSSLPSRIYIAYSPN